MSTSSVPYILGISCFYHDSSATLLRGTEIVAAAQEERFSRIKFDKSFPEKAIHYCLSHAGISIENVEIIAFYEDPIIKWDRIYETQVYYQRSIFKGLGKLKKWIDSKLYVEEYFYNDFFYIFLLFPNFSIYYLNIQIVYLIFV